MARHVKPKFKNHTLVDSNYISIEQLINTKYVNAIEVRNVDGEMNVRADSSPAEIDTYIQNEIFKLNQETIRPGIKGFDISELEISGASGNKIIIEYHL